MAYSLRCPACRVKFAWDPTEGYPEYCPNDECETRIAHDVDDNVIHMPALRSASTRANDTLYRQMEASSEKRVEQAAHMAGVHPSEMSDLKITNLLETRHEGAVAAVPVVNEVTRSMDAIRAANPNAQVGFGAGPEAGLYFSSQAHAGSSPNAGARTQSVVREMHGQRVGHDALSDRPALETQQPGYRRRV
jgi:hypothetical protein